MLMSTDGIMPSSGMKVAIPILTDIAQVIRDQNAVIHPPLRGHGVRTVQRWKDQDGLSAGDLGRTRCDLPRSRS